MLVVGIRSSDGFCEVMLWWILYLWNESWRSTEEIGLLFVGTVLLCKVPEAILLVGFEGIREVGLVWFVVGAVGL